MAAAALDDEEGALQRVVDPIGGSRARLNSVHSMHVASKPSLATALAAGLSQRAKGSRASIDRRASSGGTNRRVSIVSTPGGGSRRASLATTGRRASLAQDDEPIYCNLPFQTPPPPPPPPPLPPVPGAGESEDPGWDTDEWEDVSDSEE